MRNRRPKKPKRDRPEATASRTAGEINAIVPVSDHKPIDAWLTVGTFVLALVFFLLPDKTPTVIVAALVLCFVLLIHPVWNFWWIERSVIRRLVAIAVMGAILGFVGFVSWPKPQAPLGFMQFDHFEVTKEHSFLVAGAQFGGNALSINPGPIPVFDAVGYTASYVRDVGADTDRKVREEFDAESAPFRKNYQTGQIHGTGVGVGHGIWGTFATRQLTQHDVDGLQTGTTRIYFASWLGWRDGSGRFGESIDCRWLQSATLPAPYRKEDIIWHFCQ
jgi:hypothetical protein